MEKNWGIFMVHCLLKINLFLICTNIPATKMVGLAVHVKKYLGWEIKEKYTLQNMYDQNLYKIKKKIY